MIGVVECFFAATVIIASLKSGSRALYAISQDDKRVMDGPLILSPDDVKKQQSNGKYGEVSPLWEMAFGFRRALDLLSDTDQRNGTKNGIRTSSWINEASEENSYFIAFPHYKSNNEDSESLKMPNLEEDSRLIVASVPIEKSVIVPRNIFYKSFRKIQMLYSKIATNCKGAIARSQVLTAMFHDDPALYLQRTRQRNNMKKSTAEKDGIDSYESMDFDTVLSTIITLPHDMESAFVESPVVKRQVLIKSFAPMAFKRLRHQFGITQNDFIQSLVKSGPYVSFQSNSKGAARAGGFFFFSRDGAYMVKTIKNAELKTIREMLPKYSFFMKRNAKRSLLTRFCGLYAAQVLDECGKKSGEECFFLIMNSVFPARAASFISERFDLKGSTVGRECSEKERLEKGGQAVLKDLDLQREVDVMKSKPISFGLSKYGISIGPEAKSALLSQLRRDLKLLVSCSVMDYSLLIGVVNLEETLDKTKETLSSYLRKITKSFLHQSKIRNLRVPTVMSWLLTPILHLLAPVTFICQGVINICATAISSIIAPPFPYYGASLCGVDGGDLSILMGSRLGNRALYYLGVIDFLQPWTTQKVLEKELKGLMGYEKKAISCAQPVDYAERFLDFMDRHIT